MRALIRSVALLSLLLAVPGVALAASPAIVVRETITFPFTFEEPDFFCTGHSAVATGTETLSYQTVETAKGFHVQGIDEGSFTATIEGGGYALGGSIDRFAFNAGPGDTVNNDTHVDWISIYGPDGEFLFDATFRVVEKFTITGDGHVRVDFARIVFNDGPC